MNWTIETIDSLKIVKVITEGDFDTESHRLMIEDIISQDFWKPGMDAYFDHRKLNFHHTTIPLMRKVSASYQEYAMELGDGKLALLMKSWADFARGRQFELMTQNQVSAKLGVFMDEKETIEWLTA